MKKIRKNPNIMFSLYIVFFLAALSYGSHASAEPYFIDREIEVLTVYSSDGADRSEKKENWRISPVTIGENSITLGFYPIRKGKSASVCEVVIKGKSPQNTVSWKGRGVLHQLSGEEGFLIVPGYPAPCDILPVSQFEENKEYIIRNTVGGQTFMDRYNVTVNSMGSETARQNGWIAGGNAEPAKIVSVTVKNEKKEIVLVQLWPVNGDWWIYEETPNRKSWALP